MNKFTSFNSIQDKREYINFMWNQPLLKNYKYRYTSYKKSHLKVVEANQL